MKVIRYIIFIPICLLAIGVIYWLFGLLLGFVSQLSTVWKFIIIVFLSGTIWRWFKFLSSFIMILASSISPSKVFSFWTVFIVSIINGIWVIKNVWTLGYNNTFWALVGCIVLTMLIGQLTFAFINGAYVVTKENDGHDQIGYY